MQKNDAFLVALFRERNEDALTETRAVYGNYCTAVADAILHSAQDAEECVNDTFLAAWNSIPPHQPENLRLYLARIVRNTALNRYARIRAEKRGGGEVPMLLSELAECVRERDTENPSDIPDVSDTAETDALGTVLDRFVRALPTRERVIFVKRYFYSQSSAEIGRNMGLKENHVNVLLSRIRQKLKKELEKEGYSV